MKRYAWLFAILMPLSLGACATMGPSTKGALVNVYRPNPVKESMVCSVEGKSGISYMYVGPETVSGSISQEEKKVIAQYAKAVLGETRFINPVSMASIEGEYPDLSIRVHRFSVQTQKGGNRLSMDGIFQASFSIRQAGYLECSTGSPILVEKHYEMPAYKQDKLPSRPLVEQQLVKEAVRRVVRQFVPVKSQVLRSVKSGSELSGQAAAMIDAGNCMGAYELLKPVVSNPACEDADSLYNAGVAAECAAWNAANDQKTQFQYLRKAGEYYGKAAMLRPGDKEIQQAKGELDYELHTFFSSFERQEKTKKTLDDLKAPQKLLTFHLDNRRVGPYELSEKNHKPVRSVLLVLCVILLAPGCMRAIEQATGLELSKNMNPVMELEMNLVFLDEIAAYTKLNEMILKRVPISMDDPWPVLLNHYTQDPKEGEERAKEYYDACLNDLLRNDFFFYRTYDTALYFNLLGTGGAKALLARAVISARDLLVIEGAKALGRRYEHAKWIVSYYPLGCKCPYFSRRFGSLNPGSMECLQVKPLIQCPFFVDPTEMMLYEYLFGEGGFDSWVELQIRPECFRVVEGERLGTFEEVYYTLLPDHLQESIRRMDDEVNMTGSDLEATKALLEDDGLPSREVNRLEKEKERLDALLDKKLSAQKKLYEQAESMLEATPEKVKKARTLLLVADFIENGFAEISTAMTALSIKLADDLLALSAFGTEQITSSMTYLVTQGVASGSFAAKRAELLGKRLISLPVNYAQVWGYATAQKYRVSKYRAYLEALVKMGEKPNT